MYTNEIQLTHTLDRYKNICIYYIYEIHRPTKVILVVKTKVILVVFQTKKKVLKLGI